MIRRAQAWPCTHLMLNRRWDAGCRALSGAAPLHYAVIAPSHFLTVVGTSPSTRNTSLIILTWPAKVQQGHLQLVQLLLAKNADPDGLDSGVKRSLASLKSPAKRLSTILPSFASAPHVLIARFIAGRPHSIKFLEDPFSRTNQWLMRPGSKPTVDPFILRRSWPPS